MKSVEERKSDIERVFSRVGVKPAHRTVIDNHQVFIADGYIEPAMINRGDLKRFGVKPFEYLFGCFLTVWWTEQHKGIGSVAVFDAMHDPGYSGAEKTKMRINAVVALAKKDFMRRKMH